MKGLKILLCGLGLFLVALFCVIAGPYGNYIVGIVFGVLFLVFGFVFVVAGLLIGDSFSDLFKALKISSEGKAKEQTEVKENAVEVTVKEETEQRQEENKQ